MSEHQTYLEQVEEMLYVKGGPIAEYICNRFYSLSYVHQVTFAKAFIFSGCKNIDAPEMIPSDLVNSTERIQASRIMLLALHLGTGEPRWSSSLIDKMWDNVINTPHGQFSDLFKALLVLLQESNLPLSEAISNFITDVSYNGKIDLLVDYQTLYSNENFNWMLSEIQNELTVAQAYLIALVAPRPHLSIPSFTVKILETLVDGQVKYQHWDNVISRCYSYCNSDDMKKYLVDWLARGVISPYKEDIRDIIAKI